MNKIKVSILISTYNRANELKKCIKSILEVDFPKDEYEILVGDGGSTDSTSDYMAELVKKCKKSPEQFPHIQYFYENKNLGGMGNRIKPLYISKGRYICTLDSDATVPKNWLNSVYNLMESENLDVSGGFNLTNPKLGPRIGNDIGANGISAAPYEIRNPLYISGVATFFRRTILLKMGGFDPIMIHGGADMELGIRARVFGVKLLGDTKTIVDHTTPPKKEHFRARKNIERLTYYQFSRHVYLFMKNFDWKYGINLSFRIFLFKSFQFFGALIKKRIDFIKGYIKAIFWIISNLKTIFVNHYRVKRKIKSSKIIKKFFHPNPNIISIIIRNYRSFY